ncbi:MAG: DUF2283 domain-containing protein [Rhodoferax sp.]|uniref:DUF2283 domain-containing protein n=1 Tax=Rhodoferax sp. TaxID=50421 RepID=UPI002621C18F|nr:DUF2283 domain-containing protein [Rhodoferax sp.]MDD5335317.1 DUF2283 domain-containing protein [Rhodoferax sp.]
MNIAYDKATDSLYIHLGDCASVASDEVTDGVVLDFDASGTLVGLDVQQAGQRVDVNNLAVQSNYAEQDDILHLRMSDKPITREVSRDWNTHIGYAADGTIVEIVLLDAKRMHRSRMVSGSHHA